VPRKVRHQLARYKHGMSPGDFKGLWKQLETQFGDLGGFRKLVVSGPSAVGLEAFLAQVRQVGEARAAVDSIRQGCSTRSKTSRTN
jgi:hypothetical protein